MSVLKCKLCVIGGGSGGIGAALAASRLGVDTVLVEKESMLGGTSTVGGVNCWEPVAGATGIPYDIYRELQRTPNAAGIYSIGRHHCHPGHNDPPFPGGESVINPARSYQDTLQRCGTHGLREDEELCRKQWNGVIFEPEQFDKTVQAMLTRTGNCRIMLNSSFVEVAMKDKGEIDFVSLSDGTVIKAGLWIDNSGKLVQAAGADLLRGEDPKTLFDEPDAPEQPGDCLNAATLIFRITPRDIDAVDPLRDDIPSECWWNHRYPSLCCAHYPNGDRNCNMLPTMNGKEYFELGEEKAYAECLRRIKSYWHYLQSDFPEFRRWRICWIAPQIGVRETFRTMCEYMLNENDLLAGVSRQSHSDIIAIADHMMDSHGAGHRKSGELLEPFGIPYRCLIPKGFNNLLVAGRIAGFSTIAASSCRLSRTMMQLGQAAGTAAAIVKNDFKQIETVELRLKLKGQNVQLDD